MGSEVRVATPQSLLVGDRGRNVTYVVDVSEDMRGILVSAKQLLIRTLLRKAAFRDSLFNIVTFSGQVNSWSNHLLPCAPETLYLALAWIHSINCSSGSDLWGALSTALADPACEAVHLLCTGRPGWSEALLTALLRLAVGRPLNVFYLQSSVHRLAGDNLQRLAWATRGRCYNIPNLPCAAEKGEQPSQMYPSLCCRRPSTSVLTPRTVPSTVSMCTVGNPCMTSSVMTPEFFPGCRVLARRKLDGLYYAGTTTQEVQGCRGVWVVEFEPQEGTAWGSLSCLRELVSSLDMVSSVGGAPQRDLGAGDAVLSPWEPGVRRFGPGRVMSLSAGCRGGCGGGAASLRVQMWNSCVCLVPACLLKPILNSHYDRIVKQLQITAPPSGDCCRWPWAPHCLAQPRMRHCSSGSQTPTQRLPTGCVSSCESTVEFQEPERDGQEVMKAASYASSSSSSASSLSEQETSRRRTLLPLVKQSGGEQRPPWRYWRRTGAEPQHRQPGRVNVTRTPPPSANFHLPTPPPSTSPNHSSLFLPLCGVAGGRTTGRDVFRPHPPLKPPMGVGAAF